MRARLTACAVRFGRSYFSLFEGCDFSARRARSHFRNGPRDILEGGSGQTVGHRVLPLARVMVEGPDLEQVERFSARIAEERIQQTLRGRK